jgi:hypothetical protein
MINKDLIAPCGMNCAHCQLYLNYRYRNEKPELHGLKGGCQGCRPRDKRCGFLKQRCELLKNKKVQFCYECSDFPCENLQKLDKRYEKKGWDVSFSDNNRRIKEIGLEKFIKEQEEKWTCPVCKGPISVHGGQCINCG